MSPFETYQSNAAEVPVMRKWFFRAFILSVLIHCALFIWFKSTTLDRFSTPTDRLVPRRFNVARLDIDPKLLESEEKEPDKPLQKEMPPVPDINLPAEKPSLETMMNEVRATPAAPELTKPILNEKPRVEAASLKALAQLQENTSSALEKDLASVRDQLIKDKPQPSKALISMNEKAINRMPPGSSTDSAAMASASGRLDALLGQAGGLKKGDQPLALPGGALFEFNKAELQVPSMEQLRKLGQLIRKNPKVTFRIEGYTDSFGDEETNRRLSQARADAVRNWLIQNMDIAPERIEAHGFGKTNLLVQPQPYDAKVQASIDAEIARQQPNRRVEIVFHFPKSD